MDAYERVISATREGLYESNYIKANSPDGQRAFWIKHNLLRPLEDPSAAIAEFWVVLHERGRAPIVAKRVVPYASVRVDPNDIHIRSGAIELRRDGARGSVADLRWDLALSGGLEPLFHLPYGFLFRTGFPKKKGLTAAPNLRFDGELHVGPVQWDVRGWFGLRGHNWGHHAHTYAYGSCNVWDDGDERRTVDGITARVRLGGRLLPPLTLVSGRQPDVSRNRFRHWPGTGTIAPFAWRARWGGIRRRHAALEMTAEAADYAGLRYAHPDGGESYCYNSKFAVVRWTVDGVTATSRCGELEVLFPEPLPGIPLHPSPSWTPEQGDYRA